MKRTRRKRRDERKGWKEAGGEKVLVAWLQGVEGRRKGTLPKAQNKRGCADRHERNKDDGAAQKGVTILIPLAGGAALIGGQLVCCQTQMNNSK